MIRIMIAVAFTLPAVAVLADGVGASMHDYHEHAEMAAGQPGDPSRVDRTISVHMRETPEGMAFDPTAITISQGETIRFEVSNDGELEHEFVIGTAEANQAHLREMAEMPEMMHDDPNAIRLTAGESGALVWTFDRPGRYQFACLIPGHFEAGMHGPITVE